jgi:Pectinacetylesterase
MDRTDANSPVKDWNIVYVPYCTGDVHAGSNPAATVSGLTATQSFVGYVNVGLYLKRLVPTFSNATQVLLTGISAGGFGAAANYDQVAKAFGNVPVDMLDDSGPLMEDPFLPSCLQDSFVSLWGLDKTLLTACGADCVGDGGGTNNYLIGYLKHMAKTYPSRKFGLMDSVDDGTITNFFGFGANNCTGFTQVTADVFTAGLNDIRTQMASETNFGAYYFPGTEHTTLGSSSFDTRVAGTTKLSDWVTAFIGGTVTNAGP